MSPSLGSIGFGASVTSIEMRRDKKRGRVVCWLGLSEEEEEEEEEEEQNEMEEVDCCFEGFDSFSAVVVVVVSSMS